MIVATPCTSNPKDRFRKITRCAIATSSIALVRDDPADRHGLKVGSRIVDFPVAPEDYSNRVNDGRYSWCRCELATSFAERYVGIPPSTRQMPEDVVCSPLRESAVGMLSIISI